MEEESAGGEINIISDVISRRPEQFIYGVTENTPQQFSVSFAANEELRRTDVDRVLAWLIKLTAQYLHINQDDEQFFRYKGFFTNPSINSLGSRIVGFTLTFTCTSPFAYDFPKKKIIDITRPMTYTFINESSDNLYLYPHLLKYTPSNTTQSFSIINENDKNREFKFIFSPPYPNGTEEISINNDLQIIKSSLGYDVSKVRFNDFYNGCKLNWLRFVRGKNTLKIEGNGKLEIHYTFARRIGN